ncbi:peroxisomal membrane protein PMP34-like [Mya arenaria]|uniref:peroxisomal membrane protein PMP34-like n=1 Tax=Mya arenaria TaxID=6604 RepID=UPI0022E58BD9|nr:peroxisomal membrane protein PMP34-like [Mya arenaria]
MSKKKLAELKFLPVVYTVEDDMKNGGMSNVFSYNNLVHAVAGAVGSVVSMTVFYPLDTARTRLQVDDKRKAKHTHSVLADIVQQEGFLSLYRGLVPVVTTLCCSNFVYFYTYNSLKTVFLGADMKTSPGKDLTIAFVSGVVNVLVTTPLWVVNTRLKLQGAHMETEEMHENTGSRYKGILDCLIKIVREEGLSALWNGTKPSLVLATNPAIHFMVYEAVKRYFQHYFRQTELSGFMYFIIGAIAKTVATVVTYPLQIIQSRMRASYKKEKKSHSIIGALSDIMRVSGLTGLYKGMEAKLLQTVLTAALMFMVYEKLASATFRVMGLEYVRPATVR